MISESREKLSGKIMQLITLGRAKTFRSGVVTANLLSRLCSSVKTFSSAKQRSIESFQTKPYFIFT